MILRIEDCEYLYNSTYWELHKKIICNRLILNNEVYQNEKNLKL